MESKPLWILICGPARAGKSTTAESVKHFFQALGYAASQASFAHRVKTTAQHLFGWNNDKELYRLPDGSTDYSRGRGLLVSVAEKMKEIDPFVWVRLVADTAYNDKVIIIDDFRFRAEYDYLVDVMKHDVFVIKVDADKRIKPEEPQPGEWGAPNACNTVDPDVVIPTYSTPDKLPEIVYAKLAPFFRKVVQ